jgi:transmembrane sensor
MPKDRAIIDFEIIWKKINHCLTEEEELSLSKWLNESPVRQKYMDNVMKYYLEGSGFDGAKAETEKAWKVFNAKKIKSRHTNLRWIVSLSTAAAAIVLIIIFLRPHSEKTKITPLAASKLELIKPGTSQATLVLDDGSVYDLAASKNLVLNEGGSVIKSEGTKLQYTEKSKAHEEVKYNTLSIPRGGEFVLQLSDGTKVRLNSKTVLRYPVQFVGNERRVELVGEAFFEVAKNEKVPFLVESGEQVIKVLGTEFNISSYKENSFIYTTLVKGSVEVFIKNNPEVKQTLIPNEQSTTNKFDAQITKRKVDPYMYVAWRYGRFVFEDQNLGEIMNTLSKWYDVDVVFAQEDLKNIRFTGNLQRYSDFGEVLKKIQKTNEVEFSIENKLIIIK